MQEEVDSILPLLPKTSLSYYQDAESANKLYLRATSIRSCLENIVDTVFVHLVDFENDCTAKQWEKKTLNNKLIMLKRFFPEDINTKIHSIRQLGNKGAHQKGHSSLTDESVDETLKILSRVCEWTIFSYFQKNGFNHDSWMPTIFSTLQPAYRIRILEDLFSSLNINTDELIRHQNLVQENNRQIFSGEIPLGLDYAPMQKERELAAILLIVDKLAMAYLKNKQRNKSKEIKARNI